MIPWDGNVTRKAPVSTRRERRIRNIWIRYFVFSGLFMLGLFANYAMSRAGLLTTEQYWGLTIGVLMVYLACIWLFCKP